MKDDYLGGKRVLITGASGGLGFAMAKALGLSGATVLITARNEEKLNIAFNNLRKDQIQVEAQIMDVRSETSIKGVQKWVKEKWGNLDMLVNNAGIGMRTVNPAFLSDPQPFFKVSAAGFRDLIDTNLTGYFLVAKEFVPLFIEQGKGKIVNISMNHETMKRKGFIPYGPSRAGTESLSIIMAEDLKEYHIDVNMLLPGGATKTGMVPAEFKTGFNLLSPDIMADPIIFLASADSDGITGQRITATEFNKWKTR
jgi:gluconate 5-dehydrogenase